MVNPSQPAAVPAQELPLDVSAPAATPSPPPGDDAGAETPTTPPAPSTLSLAAPITKPIDEIRPYWRNPRRVSDEAVNALADSIKRYGYNQPITVDADGVIIVGHTRYAALRRLGATEVPVIVRDDLTPGQVKQLRVVDNRTGEYTEWDFDKLADELADLDKDLRNAFFPEVTLPDDDALDVDFSRVASGDGTDFTAQGDAEEPVEFVCPSCFHSWATQVTRDMVLTGAIPADPAAAPTTEEPA